MTALKDLDRGGELEEPGFGWKSRLKRKLRGGLEKEEIMDKISKEKWRHIWTKNSKFA